MIISGGSRCNWRFFASHLMRTDENERVEVTEIRGLLSENVREALREMDAVAQGTRCKNFFYHCNLNPREDERLTAEQWEASIDRLEHNLGLDGHARFVVEHEKHGRVHRHVVWSRIDVDDMTAVSDSFTAPVHERTAREIEAEYGLAPVESVLVKDRETERPERGPQSWENYRGQASGIDPRAMRAEITALWQGADSGMAFKSALEEAGYILARGDRRDFLIVDQAGHEHSLTKRISGAKAADVRERMGDVDKASLPGVEEARALAREAADTATGGSAPPELPGAWQPPGAPELPGERRPEGEPALAGIYRPEVAADAVAEPEEVEGMPPRVSPWDAAWRAFADRAARYADQLYALLQDERSGTPEGAMGWVARVVDAWRGGIDAEPSPPEGGAGDMARPGGSKVEQPEPDSAPQEGGGAPLAGAAAPEPVTAAERFERLAEQWAERIGEGEPDVPEAEAWDVETESQPEPDAPDYDDGPDI